MYLAVSFFSGRNQQPPAAVLPGTMEPAAATPTPSQTEPLPAAPTPIEQPGNTSSSRPGKTASKPSPMGNVPANKAATPPPVAMPAQPPAAAPPPVAKPLPKAESVTQPAILTRRVEPVYPPIARNMHIAGVVRVHITIGADGLVKSMNVTTGNVILAESAKDAIKKWVYRPATIDGHPTQWETDVEISFGMSN